MLSNLLFAISALSLLVVAGRSQNDTPRQGTARPVTPLAVWKPGEQTLQQARSACQALAFPALGECFVKQIQAAGASTEAVAFMRRLHNESYLEKFQDTGRVDIAWVIYPFRANQNSGCLLVNGMPAQLDVDNLSRLPREQLQADRSWKALLAKHPRATIWAGDRSGNSGVRSEQESGGGQRFIVDYLVLDGCHACARLAVVQYAFNFDSSGKLLTINYLSIRPWKE